MTLVQLLQQFFRSVFQWWVTVAPWEQGVRVRFGKHVELLPPGIHIRLPFVHQVFVQPTRLRAHYVEPQTLTTRDGKTIVLAAALRYDVVDVLKLYSRVHNAHDTISQRIQGVLASHAFTRNIADLVPADMAKLVLSSIDLSEYGIRVSAFELTNFAVVRVYRLINGDVGTYSDYSARIDTRSADGDMRIRS